MKLSVSLIAPLLNVRLLGATLLTVTTRLLAVKAWLPLALSVDVAVTTRVNAASSG